MTLALIAGTGGLPPHLAKALMDRGEVPVICEMEGFASEVSADLPRLGFRLETLGTFIATLLEIGVTGVCMAGAMRRPVLDPAAVDARTEPLMPRFAAALAKGDDGTLREFVALFEEHGLEVIGAAEIAPDLLPPLGGLASPPEVSLDRSMKTARDALWEMTVEDLGQALVAWDGAVICREDDRGTDAMLEDLIAKPGILGMGAILFKAPKSGQELRVDMPTIGPRTAELCVKAQLAGIVIEHQGVLVLDRPEVIRNLTEAGLFLEVLDRVGGP